MKLHRPPLLTLSAIALLSPVVQSQAPTQPPKLADAIVTTSPRDAVVEAQLASMQRKLNDWPALARYRADNAKLSDPLLGEKRVVFMGDSITNFWGRGKDHGEFFPGKPYVNRGISGQTTPQMLIRFQQGVIHLHPAVVVILAGINDVSGNTGPSTPEMIEDNLASMALLAKANHIRVVMASILPASYFPWKPTVEPAETVKELNRWIEDYCKREGFVFLNYYPAMADDRGGMRPELAFAIPQTFCPCRSGIRDSLSLAPALRAEGSLSR